MCWRRGWGAVPEPGSPWFWLIAGPNGVGKTTYAMRHLKAVVGAVHFVNLDEIARGLSPLDAGLARLAAGRVALLRARELIRLDATFSMESTLSGQAHYKLVAEAARAGYRFGLLYFSVARPDTCLERVARRVAEGGHDVPAADVRRRFRRGAARFELYAAVAERWRVLNNEGLSPRVAAEGERERTTFRDPELLTPLPEPLRNL